MSMLIDDVKLSRMTVQNCQNLFKTEYCEKYSKHLNKYI